MIHQTEASSSYPSCWACAHPCGPKHNTAITSHHLQNPQMLDFNSTSAPEPAASKCSGRQRHRGADFYCPFCPAGRRHDGRETERKTSDENASTGHDRCSFDLGFAMLCEWLSPGVELPRFGGQ